MSTQSAFVAAIRVGGIALAILVASCAPAELGSPVVFSPIPEPTQISLNQSATAYPTPTFEPTPAPLVTVSLKVGSPIVPGPTPSPIETSLNQNGTALPTSALEPTPTPPADGEPESQLITLINHERASQGLAGLVMVQRLQAAAQAHSQDMAQHHFFDHLGSNGSTPGDRITNENYQWKFFAENLGCGHPTAEALLQGWLDSPDHRANMLAPEAKHIGIGFVYTPNNDCTYYWTGLFAAEE